MSDRITALSGWYSVGKALSEKLSCQLDELQILDFWRSAVGIRVSYRFRYGMKSGDEYNETIQMNAEEAEQLMWMVTQ